MFIKRPGKDRKSFALIGLDGKTVKDPRVDEVNRDLLAGVARDILESRMQRILREYKPKPQLNTLEDANQALAKKVLNRSLLRNPDMANPRNYEHRLLAAARYMGSIIVEVASESTLLTHLRGSPTPASRFEYTARINEMLAYLGRRPLPNKRPFKGEPDYIRVAHFVANAHRLREEHRIFLGALFATGCRIAELPEILVKDGGARVDITCQWHMKRRQLWPTKSKKHRSAPTLPGLRAYVLELHKIPKDTLRTIVTSYRPIYSACKKALGVTPHILRHSYCVELASAGLSSHQIARYIGDTVDVVEKYYRNHLATDDELRAVLQALKA